MGVIGTAARQARKVKKLSKKATEGQKKIEKATREQRAYAKGQVKAAAATAGLAGLGLAELRSRLKEAETEKERAQLQAAIEKTMRQMAQEEGMDKKSKGGMARKKYAKGGYANCGASMKPTQKSSMKK
jgi:hypothetical protein